eukprot:gene5284-6124_t
MSATTAAATTSELAVKPVKERVHVHYKFPFHFAITRPRKTRADTAGSLLIVFRLWRLIRIGHAIAVTVETHDSTKYKELKHKYKRMCKETGYVEPKNEKKEKKNRIIDIDNPLSSPSSSMSEMSDDPKIIQM